MGLFSRSQPTHLMPMNANIGFTGNTKDFGDGVVLREMVALQDFYLNDDIVSGIAKEDVSLGLTQFVAQGTVGGFIDEQSTLDEYSWVDRGYIIVNSQLNQTVLSSSLGDDENPKAPVLVKNTVFESSELRYGSYGSVKNPIFIKNSHISHCILEHCTSINDSSLNYVLSVSSDFTQSALEKISIQYSSCVECKLVNTGYLSDTFLTDVELTQVSINGYGNYIARTNLEGVSLANNANIDGDKNIVLSKNIHAFFYPVKNQNHQFEGTLGNWNGTAEEFLDIADELKNISVATMSNFVSVSDEVDALCKQLSTLLGRWSDLNNVDVHIRFDSHSWDANMGNPSMIPTGRYIERNIYGRTVVLQEMKASRDLPVHNVKEGDIGGFLEETVSTCSQAWVTSDSVVIGDSKLSNHSFISGGSLVDSSSVSGRVISSVLRNSSIGFDNMIFHSVVKSSTIKNNVYNSALQETVIHDAIAVISNKEISCQEISYTTNLEIFDACQWTPEEEISEAKNTKKLTKDTQESLPF